VNVSSIQFTHRDMLKLVETLLGETGADPHWITLELSENVFGARSQELIAVFRRLRQMGTGLSIDDFGTDYSSLGYLDTFPLSGIKIDKRFVGNLRESSLTRVIVDAIIKIGRELNVMVSAEGVESAAELSTLRDLGCPQRTSAGRRVSETCRNGRSTRDGPLIIDPADLCQQCFGSVLFHSAIMAVVASTNISGTKGLARNRGRVQLVDSGIG
jgi:predicted signal transduction protein with EAL and GGDEF domain